MVTKPKIFLSILLFIGHLRMILYVTKNFKFLRQGNYEITGGCRPDPLWYPMWFQKLFVSEGLRTLVPWTIANPLAKTGCNDICKQTGK